MIRRGVLGVLAISLWAVAPLAWAATLSVSPGQGTFSPGDAGVFAVRLDTDEQAGECINAVSGVLEFNGPVVPIDVSTGNSILSVWVEPPAIDSAEKRVRFSGGVPNGYCGRIDGDPSLTNVLLEVIARVPVDAPADTVGTVSLSADTTAYLNDGRGTRAAVQTLPSTVTVQGGATNTVADPWSQRVAADTVPPREFSIMLAQDTAAFAKQYYISFNTTDKQTGIDHYEVMEEPLSQAGAFLWGRADAPWREVVSPYVLRDQSLNSIIRVKAVDKAGNEYVANLIPDAELRSLSLSSIVYWVLAGTLVLLVAVAGYLYWRRRQTQRTTAELYDYDI